MPSHDEVNKGSALGQRIAAAREAKRLTQGDLAQEVLGSTRPATVSDWERGVRTPDTQTLARIAEALGVSAGYLMGDDGSPVPGLEAVEGASMSELYVRWDRIEDDDCPAWLKALRQDVLVALVRADAMRQEGIAARERAVALREEAAATRDRSEAVKAEAENANARLQAMQPEATAPAPGKATPEETAAVARQAIPKVPQKRGGSDSRRHGAG